MGRMPSPLFLGVCETWMDLNVNDHLYAGLLLGNNFFCRTYTIPKEVKEWREWMNTQKGRDGTMWMLKTAQHLGKGLNLVPYQRAIKEMLTRHESAEAAKAAGKAKQACFLPSHS